MKTDVDAYFHKLCEDEEKYKGQLLVLQKQRASMTSKEYELKATLIQQEIDKTIDLFERMKKAIFLYEELILAFKKCDSFAENAYENETAINIMNQLKNLGCQVHQVERNDTLSYFAS